MIGYAELGITEAQWDAIRDNAPASLSVKAYPLKHNLAYQDTKTGSAKMRLTGTAEYIYIYGDQQTTIHRYNKATEVWDTCDNQIDGTDNLAFSYPSSNQDSNVALGDAAVDPAWLYDISNGLTPLGNLTGGGGLAAAFDDNSATNATRAAANGIIGVDAVSDIAIRRVTIQESIGIASTAAPSAFTVQSSPDNSVWTTRLTVTGQTGWTDGQIRTFDIPTVTLARYWRLNITATNGAALCAVGEVEFMTIPVFGYLYGSTKLTQTINIASPTIVGGIGLWMKKVGTPVGVATIRIETVSGGNPTGTLADPNATVTFNEEDLSASYSLVRKYFSRFTLAAGDYAIVVSTARVQSGDDEFNYTHWGADGSAPSYSGGEMKTFAGSWVAAAKDAIFYIYNVSTPLIRPMRIEEIESTSRTMLTGYSGSYITDEKYLKMASGGSFTIAGSGTTVPIGYSGSNIRPAQSFILPYPGTLDEITIPLDVSTGTPTGTVTWTIKKYGIDPSGGNIIATGSFSPVANSINVIPVTGGARVFLGRGAYMLYLNTVPNQVATNRWNWKASNASVYSDGKANNTGNSSGWLSAVDCTMTIKTVAITSNDKLAQGFQVTSAANMQQVRLFLKKLGNPTGTLTASVYSDSGGNPNTLLATSNPVEASSLFDNFNFIDFDFASVLALSASTQYHLVLESSDAASNEYFAWACRATSPSYSGGTMKNYSSGAWNTETADAIFYIYSEESLINTLYGVFINQSTDAVYYCSSLNNGSDWLNVSSAVRAAKTFKGGIPLTSAGGYVWELDDATSVHKEFFQQATPIYTYSPPGLEGWPYPISAADFTIWEGELLSCAVTEIPGTFTAENLNVDPNAEGQVEQVKALIVVRQRGLFDDADGLTIPAGKYIHDYVIVDQGNNRLSTVSYGTPYFSVIDGKLTISTVITFGSKGYPLTALMVWESLDGRNWSFGDLFYLSDNNQDAGMFYDDGTSLWYFADTSRKLYRGDRARGFFEEDGLLDEEDISAFVVDFDMNRAQIQDIGLTLNNSMGYFNAHAIINKTTPSMITVDAIYTVAGQPVTIPFGRFYTDSVNPDVSGDGEPTSNIVLAARDKGRNLLGFKNSDDYFETLPVYEKFFGMVVNSAVNLTDMAVISGAFDTAQIANATLDVKGSGGTVFAIHTGRDNIEHFAAEIQFMDYSRHASSVGFAGPFIGIVFHYSDQRNYREVYLGSTGVAVANVMPIAWYYREMRDGVLSAGVQIATGSLSLLAPPHRFRLAVSGGKIFINGSYASTIAYPSAAVLGLYATATNLAHKGIVGINVSCPPALTGYPELKLFRVRELRNQDEISNAIAKYAAFARVGSDVQARLFQGGSSEVVLTCPIPMRSFFEVGNAPLDDSSDETYRSFDFDLVGTPVTPISMAFVDPAEQIGVIFKSSYFGAIWSAGIEGSDLGMGALWENGAAVTSVHNQTLDKSWGISPVSSNAYRYHRLWLSQGGSSVAIIKFYKVWFYRMLVPTIARTLDTTAFGLTFLKENWPFHAVVKSSVSDYYEFRFTATALEIHSPLAGLVGSVPYYPWVDINVRFYQVKISATVWRHYIWTWFDNDIDARSLITRDVTSEWAGGWAWGDSFEIVNVNEVYPLVLDAEEAVMNSIARSLEGRYYKQFMRYDGSFKIFIPGERSSVWTPLNPYNIVPGYSLIERASHIKVRGAEVEADYLDDEAAQILNGYKFKLVDNPYLLTEEDCYNEAVRIARMLAEQASKMTFDCHFNPFLEPDDLLTLTGYGDFILEAINIKYDSGNFVASYETKESQA